jgi:hypothetical protein
MMRDDRGLIIIGHAADLPEGVKPAQRMTFTASEPKIPASGFWERQTVERMALDLRDGSSPEEVVRTWAKWHPEKGNEAFFTALVERALPDEARKAWITTAPSEMNARAMPSPMPAAAPEMSVTSPSKRPIYCPLYGIQGYRMSDPYSVRV